MVRQCIRCWIHPFTLLQNSAGLAVICDQLPEDILPPITTEPRRKDLHAMPVDEKTTTALPRDGCTRPNHDYNNHDFKHAIMPLRPLPMPPGSRIISHRLQPVNTTQGDPGRRQGLLLRVSGE